MSRTERILLWIAVGAMVVGTAGLVVGILVIYLRYAMGVW